MPQEDEPLPPQLPFKNTPPRIVSQFPATVETPPYPVGLNCAPITFEIIVHERDPDDLFALLRLRQIFFDSASEQRPLEEERRLEANLASKRDAGLGTDLYLSFKTEIDVQTGRSLGTPGTYLVQFYVADGPFAQGDFQPIEVSAKQVRLPSGQIIQEPRTFDVTQWIVTTQREDATLPCLR